jgi:hypothetical protein
MTQMSEALQSYKRLEQQHSTRYKQLNERYNLLGTARLAVALFFFISLYFLFRTVSNIWLAALIAAAIGFIALLKVHGRISRARLLHKTLAAINTDELSYLNHSSIPFDGGTEFNDPAHAYANDLDMFGYKSAFQHLNRTATYTGRNTLAQLLLRALNPKDIKDNQDAVKELSGKQEWRQQYYALARIASDNKAVYTRLTDWSKDHSNAPNKAILILAYIAGAAMVGSLIAYTITFSDMWSSIAGKLFIANLLLLGSQLKKIKQELVQSDKIAEIIHEYSRLISAIENETFASAKMQGIQQQLKQSTGTASGQIKQLGSLFSQMDSMLNPLGAIILNGVVPYHLFTYQRLADWKQQHAVRISGWLDIIGEVETLNSLANLAYNNPSFCYPQLNEQRDISFTALGHPFIDAGKRVCNSISFAEHRFVILTGSNMSGKSTFLRTLGVNMVLAGIGAPVCATSASVHPMEILVSMRQSDSLADSESYFFAEVKRLKYIISQLQQKTCFVLLDEILRGTNSDDKRSGTIGVIEKIIAQHAIGAIATHDLEVCLTTEQHPHTLINKCFEVEIINDELVFDYKLRNGICRNKSATFLMKKMEII